MCYVVTIISCLGENHSKYCCGGCDSFALSGKTFLCSGIIFASEFRGPEFEPSNCLGTSILLLEVASSYKRNEIFSPHWWIGGGGGGEAQGPISVQFLSFSCSFRQNSCQIIGPNSGVGAPIWEILDAPLVTTRNLKISFFQKMPKSSPKQYISDSVSQISRFQMALRCYVIKVKEDMNVFRKRKL